MLIAGNSMEPTLNEGEFVLIECGRIPLTGDLAVFHHPDDDGVDVVKRVAAVNGDGAFVVKSDNPTQGSDSRTWGPLAPSSMVGTVTLVLNRPNSLVN